jgi:hypothetical protein
MSPRIFLWLWLAGIGCHSSPTPSPKPVPPRVTAAQRAAELEKKAEAQVQGGDSSRAAEASQLWAQAGQEWRHAGNDSSSAAAFERAGVLAHRAGQTDSAFLHFGSALQVRDSLARGQIRDMLESAPLALRDAELEASFVGRARALMVALGILDAATARKSIRNAIQAFAALEDLGAGSNQVRIVLLSLPDTGLEVRMRRWIAQFENAPWTTVRVDTMLTLVRPPMHYEFCYIEPTTGLPMLIDQPCADGCKVELPSKHATSAGGIKPSCAGDS